MKPELQIAQLEAEMISHDNTIESIKGRIATKNEIITAINKPGRPDAIVLEYGDRTVTLPVEEPAKYGTFEDYLIGLIKGDITDLTKALDKQATVKKQTEKKIAELKNK